MNTLTELALNFLDLFLDSAPWLLLGLFMAGMIKMFVPMSWMQKQLGGHGVKPTVKAAIFGAPLPLCSCGVIPAAVGLRRSGASKSATTAFLVATPETGVDSVSVSYVLLGPFMAVVRPITAVVSAIVAGLLVGRDQHEEAPAEPQSKPTPKFTPVASGGSMMAAPAMKAESVSCCASKAAAPAVKAQSSCCSGKTEVKAESASCCGSKSEVKAESTSCCSSKPEVKAEAASCCANKPAKSEQGGCCSSKKEAPAPEGVVAKLVNGVNYAATDLVRDTTLWLLIGLFFAALVNTFVPASFLSQWGDGILAMTVMVLVSIPMYICATASTPIAAGLLLAGVSPGAVLVFMMAGPATNIATLGVVRNELGKRALWAYLTGVIGTAMLFGFAVDYAVAEFGFKVMPLVGEEHRMLPHWLVYGSGVLLAILMVKAMWSKWMPARTSLA
ncbi:SO_0444 family Cu/Zn efflux transporter [Ferrimonas balearica]|uniref:SO_0444 family Cu/Zn efflux transporter n=1 Tax=Ferrimonas balearica TaxID=44012 RepID=UPI001F2E7742|nr:SO_0444 family Cu/Zn efflux transporter [Ferrimonas balearica]MBY6096440.1 SO_0444 family Cu/Zn efflux transporter [Ferrimonas balearica]